MAKNHRYLAGIFGGIGSGKKILAEKLSRRLVDTSEIIVIPADNYSAIRNFKKINYRIFIDRPFDQLLEKFVLNLPLESLQDHQKLAKKLENFRKFHLNHVAPHRVSANYYFQGDVENEDKIHHLALEILKNLKISKNQDPDDESEDVKIYLEACGSGLQKCHPSKLTNIHLEVF